MLRNVIKLLYNLEVNINDFTFKNETEFKRTQDYTEVLGMNSNLITIEN